MLLSKIVFCFSCRLLYTILRQPARIVKNKKDPRGINVMGIKKINLFLFISIIFFQFPLTYLYLNNSDLLSLI